MVRTSDIGTQTVVHRAGHFGRLQLGEILLRGRRIVVERGPSRAVDREWRLTDRFVHARRKRPRGAKLIQVAVKKLREEIKHLATKDAKTKTDTQVNVSEVKRPEMDAKLVGQNIAHQLVKKINYRRAVKKSIQSTMRMGADGIRIRVAGRLGGADIARQEIFREGRVPLQTLRSDIDFAITEARTTYGTIGIKVWICKGEVSG